MSHSVLSNVFSSIRTLGMATVAAFSLSACGPVEETPSLGLDQATQAITFTGIAPAGTIGLKNGTGVCAVKSGTRLKTETCSSASAQSFELYSSGGGYFMCKPGSIKPGTSGQNCSCNIAACSCETYLPAYVGECLIRESGTNKLEFWTEVVLATSFDNGNTYKGEPGPVIDEGTGILGYRNSNRKLTKDSSNTVVLGKYSGNADQKWSPVGK